MPSGIEVKTTELKLVEVRFANKGNKFNQLLLEGVLVLRRF